MLEKVVFALNIHQVGISLARKGGICRHTIRKSAKLKAVIKNKKHRQVERVVDMLTIAIKTQALQE